MLRGLWLAVVLAIAPASANAEDDRHIVPIRHVTLHDLDNGSTQAITQLPARRLLEPRGFRRFSLEADFELVDRSVAPLWALYHRQLSDGARVRINGVIVGMVTEGPHFERVPGQRPPGQRGV